MRSLINFLLVFQLFTTTCFSQIEPEVTNVTKVTILSPGISYEKRIGKVQTLKFDARMSFSMYWGYSESFGNTAGVHFDPSLGIEYRYYYNAGKRWSLRRRTEMNSMNYVSAVHRSRIVKKPSYDTAYSNRDFRFLNTVGIVWGLQRNYDNRFSVDLNVGLGYVYSKELSSYYGYKPTGWGERYVLITSVELGFWLNRR